MIVILTLLWVTLLSHQDEKRLPGTFLSLDSSSDWMENFTLLSPIFENKFGGEKGFLCIWKGKCFLLNAAFLPYGAARPWNAAKGWSVCFLSPLRQSTLIRLEKEPFKNQMWSSMCSAETAQNSSRKKPLSFHPLQLLCVTGTNSELPCRCHIVSVGAGMSLCVFTCLGDFLCHTRRWWRRKPPSSCSKREGAGQEGYQGRGACRLRSMVRMCMHWRVRKEDVALCGTEWRRIPWEWVTLMGFPLSLFCFRLHQLSQLLLGHTTVTQRDRNWETLWGILWPDKAQKREQQDESGPGCVTFQTK